MIFAWSGLLFVLSGFLLGSFSYARRLDYKKNPVNKVNYYYYTASGWITFGFFMYGAPSLIFGNQTLAIVIGGIIATISNTIGFGKFLMIPIYNHWDNKKYHIYFQYCLYFYSILITALLIIKIPQSIIDQYGVIHWRFGLTTSVLTAGLMLFSFSLNIIVLLNYLKKLISLSLINVVALVVAFALAGASGSYLYIGDSAILLAISSIFLFLGFILLFFSVIKKRFKK